MQIPNIGDIGHILEGTIEKDPLDDSYSIRLVRKDGTPDVLKISDLLDPYMGQEVRLTLASIEAIEKLTKIFEEGEEALGN